jgi:quercetin dioxygenase-like cupin family protein
LKRLRGCKTCLGHATNGPYVVLFRTCDATTTFKENIMQYANRNKQSGLATSRGGQHRRRRAGRGHDRTQARASARPRARVADGKGQQMGPTQPKDVTDVVRATTDLSKEPAHIDGRQFRLRQLEMKPGGIVPWHSHDNRPRMIYIVSGEVVEYASNCAVPIVHKAGDIAPEKNGTSHWWKNTGNTTAVLISVDLFPVGDSKMDNHMM